MRFRDVRHLWIAAAWMISVSTAEGASNPHLESFAWAPDGKLIAYTSGGPRVSIIDARTGSRHVAMDTPPGPCNVVWHPTSKILMVAGERSISVLHLAAGPPRTIMTSKVTLKAVQFSPDGNWISYVAGGKLFIRPLKGGGARMIAQNVEPDWMYRHKLAIETGYWWAPDSSAIASLETDPMPSGKLFPVAGEALPRVSIRITGIHSGSRARTMQLPSGGAYFPQVVWNPDGRSLGIQRLDRIQTTLQLLLADAATGKVTAILKETDPYWVNSNPRNVVFLPGGKRFLWMSERSGFNHIYLYETSSGQLISQLTQGDWAVTSIDAVDDHSVCFTSTQQSAIERHAYRTSIDTLGPPTRLTATPGWHAVKFSPDAQSFLDLSSRATQLPSVHLSDPSGGPLAVIVSGQQLAPVEFSTVNTHDGLVLNTMLMLPPAFDPAQKYPALILAPTGPRTQIVRNASDSPDLLWARAMADLGFVVFAADGRGSGGRGRRFEEPIHYRLGGMELPDQLDALSYLRRLGYVDMKRVGMFGSEFGGMLAIGAMLHSHGVYRSGFAASPITDWTAVDAFSAERYLGQKAGAAVPYLESSPNEFAGKLEGRLHVTIGFDEPAVHMNALREELDEKHKLKADRATMETADPASMFDRATRFFVETLLR